MSDVFAEGTSLCIQCPELIRLKKEFEEQDILRKMEIARDRQRIQRLEADIIKLKKAFIEVSAIKSTGSWGVTRKRAEIIYSRLLASIKGNGCPWISTGDVKMALGVLNYSQALAAMKECVRIHKETRLSRRGKIYVIECFDPDIVVDMVDPKPAQSIEKKTNKITMVPELARFMNVEGRR